MRIANLRIENFRGVKSGFVQFGRHPVLVGDNNTGKTTLIEALALVLGRDRLVRELTEHDFFGSNPQAADRIKVVATVTDFPGDDPEQSSQWFRDQRAIVKWLDEATGQVHPARNDPAWKLCCQLGVQARFDQDSLAVETVRYFHDHDDPIDPFADEAPAPVPGKLIQELSFYLVRASRTWDKVFSWGNELFKRTVLAAAAQPSGALLAERDRLRAPAQPIDADPGIQPLIENLNSELARSFPNAPKVQLRLTSTDSRSVMEAVSAHFAGNDGFSIPAGRQGSGLVSMQGLLLLLELGRARAANGGEFIMAVEEPEVHLPPSAQQRLVQRVQALSTQTFVTTHSPLIASMAEPTSVLVLKKHDGVLSAEPFLDSPLPAAAPNWKRKFFQHSRVDVLSALMQPVLLVPEGILVVDEAQDMTVNRLGMVAGLANGLELFVAADEFQCLSEELRPNPACAWLTEVCAPEELTQPHRTNVDELLNAARAIRAGQAPKSDKFFMVAKTPTGPLAGAWINSNLSWYGGGKRVAIITPTHGTFARSALAWAAANKTSKGAGPYNVAWEQSEAKAAAEYLAKIQLADRADSVSIAAVLAAAGDARTARDVTEWLEIQRRTRAKVQFTKDEVVKLVEQSFSQRRQSRRSDDRGWRAMTVHGAKNREFDNVIVLWPAAVGGSDDQKRRLLYNAVTRARERCIVLVQAAAHMSLPPFV